MDYLPRALAATMRRVMSTFPVMMVTGARQSGKTTLLVNEFGKTHRYVSMDRPDVRDRALSDPIAFLQENPPPLILDEIQQATGLLPYIKDRVDTDRSPGQWLLTGSQKFQFMRGVGETLAGRVAVLELDPLSVRELCSLPAPASFDDLIARTFTGETSPCEGEHTTPSLSDWMLRGGYPEIRLNTMVDRQIWFSSYIQTHLERDVRDLIQVGDLGAFGRFLKLVAARSGMQLNATELGSEVGITGPTVKRWLSVLQTSHVIHLLPPFYRNFGKRLRKSPKLYLIDPGLVTFLLGLHTDDAVLHGPSLGALAESAVVAEWLKAARQLGEQVDYYYWRSSGGLEVDLVMERDGHIYGLEIKATATPTPRHADPLARWLDLAGEEASGAVACRIEKPVSLRPRVRAVPWHLAW